MSEPMATSDALCGVDGTQLPEPLPVLADPLTGLTGLTGLGRGTWPEAPEFPPLALPPLPDASVIREAIAAALADDAGATAGAVDQDSTVAPDPQPAWRPVPAATPALQATVFAPIPPAPIPPAPSQPRRSAKRRNRPPMAAVSGKPVPPADLRRRIRRERVGLPLRASSEGGAAAFFLVILIIIGVLVYNIVTGFLELMASWS